MHHYAYREQQIGSLSLRLEKQILTRAVAIKSELPREAERSERPAGEGGSAEGAKGYDEKGRMCVRRAMRWGTFVNKDYSARCGSLFSTYTPNLVKIS